MPTSYQIFQDRGLVMVTTRGEIDLTETVRSLELLFNDPAFSLEYDLLWDASGITNALTFDEMQEVLRHFRFYQGEQFPKRAIVVSRSVKFATSRVIHTLSSVSSHSRIGLFEDRGEALRWLKR